MSLYHWNLVILSRSTSKAAKRQNTVRDVRSMMHLVYPRLKPSMLRYCSVSMLTSFHCAYEIASFEYRIGEIHCIHSKKAGIVDEFAKSPPNIIDGIVKRELKAVAYGILLHNAETKRAMLIAQFACIAKIK